LCDNTLLHCFNISCLYEMLKAVSYESVPAGLDGMLRPGTCQCSSFQCFVQLSQESRDRVLIIMLCTRRPGRL